MGFGGNPGGRQGKEDRLRLGDFWKLHLYRPDHREILRRCCLKARQSKFMELTYDENSQAKALSYLQTMISEIVDHSDDGEEDPPLESVEDEPLDEEDDDEEEEEEE